MGRTPDILIDGHDLGLDQPTGVATYAAGLCARLVDMGLSPTCLAEPPRGPEGRLAMVARRMLWSLAPSVRMAPTTPPNWAPAGASVVAVERVFQRARWRFRRRRDFLRLTPDRPYRLAHFVKPTPLTVDGAPSVVTVHDVIPLLLPGATGAPPALVRALLAASLARADHVVTVSESVRADLLSMFPIEPERVTTTYQSAPPPTRFAQQELVERLRRLSLSPGGYFLYYGAIDPKKNLPRLLDAHALSGTRRPLVLALGRDFSDPATSARLDATPRLDASTPPLSGAVRLPYQDREHLDALIAGARAVMLPSLAEGFGLPILEAFQAGVPVLTSAGGATGEIAGAAAALVAALDVREIAAAIARLDADDTLCSTLSGLGLERAQLFSAERHTQRLRAVYRRVAPGLFEANAESQGRRRSGCL